jgi:hypothetical protein
MIQSDRTHQPTEYSFHALCTRNMKLVLNIKKLDGINIQY